MTKADDGTIDVSHMTEKEYRRHMRHLEQLMTCPCVNCQAICDRWLNVSKCTPYQRWLEYNKPRRRP